MATLSQVKFLKTLPNSVIPLLPEPLRGIQVRQPWQWLVQLHYGEPRLHYEVSRAWRHNGWEIGFHCEADATLNRFLLDGFRRHLFEIKDTLGERVEAEMWDKGWTKIYEVCQDDRELTEAYQQKIGRRLADMIICLHPIYVNLRGAVAHVYR